MSFDQGQFNFDSKTSEDGYRKWREELDAEKLAFETRWGIILSRRVCVSLLNHQKPLIGILEWVRKPAKPTHNGQPLLRLKGAEFTPANIESIIQLEND